MKKFILIALLVSFSISSFAQRNSRANDDWYLSIGVNAINSLGTRSPFNSPSDWAFDLPISAAAEYNWSDTFAIEQSVTFNGFTEDTEIDGTELSKDYTYISFDTNVKYYFGQFIFPNLDWLEIHANAGVGFFHIDETNISANLGGGVLFWLNANRTFGLRLQTTGKFAFNHPESGFDNNHFQHHLQVVFKL
ncbi:outer membrane beta-barrel protein [Winogradskyella helgolandensis]|uniref:outer membrane beta-barrel protein n=1 Tax=Winogradskyella helgolandensis TaxID=2697010 RepID=UPI0015CA693F|nr:outer membrane beta-barrel protein [Winogradskyella helgolandensis]